MPPKAASQRSHDEQAQVERRMVSRRPLGHRGASPGVGVDAFGGGVIDPTKNVLDLVGAATLRIDDLANLRTQLQGERVERVDLLRQADSRRLEELRLAESRRVDSQMRTWADHQRDLSAAEAKRIDAIRQIDVAAVAVAHERATQQATTLAAQVATSADALRTLVATTASAMATQTQNFTTQFTDRLAVLERTQYEDKGRQNVINPQMAEYMEELKSLRLQIGQNTGKSQGMSASWGLILGVVGLVSTLLSIGAVVTGIIIFVLRGTGATPIYVPAPANTMLPSNPPATTPR